MTEATEMAWVTPTSRLRRRVVLPPIGPVLTPVVGPPGSGSRFDPIGEVSDDEDEISVAEEVVWRGLDDVPHVLPLRNVNGQGDGEHLDEFWSKIGYPTAASRSWERKTAAATSGGQRARSSSPTRTVKPAGGGRPASSSPPVFRLPKPPMKMKAWKGPLPPRRITPPAMFADFVDVARVVSVPMMNDAGRLSRPAPRGKRCH